MNHPRAKNGTAPELAASTPLKTPSIMRRLPGITVDECIQIGWKLLVLSESVGRGGFTPAVESLGVHPSTARRLIRSARLFSHLPQVRKHLPNRSVMFELLNLDGAQLDELERTGRVGILDMKNISRYSVNELRLLVRSVRRREHETRIKSTGKSDGNDPPHGP